MKVSKKFGEDISPPKMFDECKVTRCGNVTEVSYQSNVNRQCYVQKVDKDTYVDLRTGEALEVHHSETRSEGQKSLAKTFKRLRDIINTNITDVQNARWITLTYAENMTDVDRLYEDFRKFNMRFQYYCQKQGLGKPEYIVAVEPQARGAWHCHLLYIWSSPAPFIPNEKLREIWGHGFVMVSSLDNVTNVGAYLSAYLTDLSEEETSGADTLTCAQSEVKVIQGEHTEKKFVKGARLKMYPTGIHLFRHSRQIKEPVIAYADYHEIQKKLSGEPKSYERQVVITDESTNYSTTVYTCQYKIQADKSQELFESLEELSARLNKD